MKKYLYLIILLSILSSCSTHDNSESDLDISNKSSLTTQKSNEDFEVKGTIKKIEHDLYYFIDLVPLDNSSERISITVDSDEDLSYLSKDDVITVKGIVDSKVNELIGKKVTLVSSSSNKNNVTKEGGNSNANTEIEKAEISILEIYAEHDELLDGRTGGRIPLLVKVKVKNTGADTEKWTTNTAAFTLSTNDGRTFESSFGTKLNKYGEKEKELPFLYLRAGQSSEGWVAFEPEWSTKYILNYSDNRSYLQIPFELPKGKSKISIVPNEPITSEIIAE